MKNISWYNQLNIRSLIIVFVFVFTASTISYLNNNRQYQILKNSIFDISSERIEVIQNIVDKTLTSNGEEIIRLNSYKVLNQILLYLEKNYRDIKDHEKLVEILIQDQEFQKIANQKFMDYGYTNFSIALDNRLILIAHDKKDILGRNLFDVVDAMDEESKIKQKIEVFKKSWINKLDTGIYFEQTKTFKPSNVPENFNQKYAFQVWENFKDLSVVAETTTYIDEFMKSKEQISDLHSSILNTILEHVENVFECIFNDNVLFTTVSFAVLIVILAMYNEFNFIRPVKKIISSLIAFKHCDFDNKISLKCNNEFKIIENISNDMAESLKNSINELALLNQELEDKVIERTKDLNLEKEKSERLLLNILPEPIAKRLKDNKEEYIANRHENVSILFTDFKGFTSITEKVEAERLVRELNEIFGYFDDLCLKYKLEKIKTIGDSYMVCSNLCCNENNQIDSLIQCAFEMRDYVNNRKKDSSKLAFDIRIGLNTGNVIAGVIGKIKFIYDIWGDSVNIASRMESASIPGKINISESTYEIIKSRYETECRGEMDIKGKGKMKSYFIEPARR